MTLSVGQKLWQLLRPHERRAAVVLFFLLLVGMGLETLGIGLVIPALALMTESELATKYPMLAPVLAQLGNPTHQQLVAAGMLALVAVYAVKTAFLAFLAWSQARFIYELQANISYRLFAGYLRQDYAFHLDRNSSQLLQNTVNLVGTITNVLQQGLLLMAEVLVMLGISAMLLAVEPLGALLVVSTLGLAGWVSIRITRQRIQRWGAAVQMHERLRIQQLQEGLGGAKDVKLLGREADFLAQYQQHNLASARVGQRQNTLIALPRLWLELLAIVGLAALVLVMLAQHKPLAALLPTLGLFAAAAFRLMPSVNRVLVALQYVRFSMSVIDTIHGELQMLDKVDAPKPGQPLPLRHAIELQEVRFQYAAADSPSLRGVSLSVPRGASVGFVGGSGAGKSTLVDTILGLLTPTGGAVKIDGVDIQTNLRGWQDQIGYVPQSIYLTDDSLRRNIAFGLPPDQIDEAAVWRALRAAQLEEFVKQLPQGLDTLVGERGVRLSGGQRQRIGIARALYHDPAVLVLDEATSSLDMATETEVMAAVQALHGEKTLLIVAHRLSTVEHCDRLYRLEKGHVVQEGETGAVLGAVAGTGR